MSINPSKLDQPKLVRDQALALIKKPPAARTVNRSGEIEAAEGHSKYHLARPAHCWRARSDR
jgi:hypothetical protein